MQKRISEERVLYIGSVRFYKHLILSTVALMIVVPTVLAFYFGVQNHRNKALAEEYKNHLATSTLPQMEYLTGVDYTEVITVPSFGYQEDYPDLYVEEKPQFKTVESEKPVVYLTFDDGPSANTETVLDILKANGIKATFFVVNNDIEAHQHLYKRIVDEGHTLGIHTYSHQYNKIYSSVDEYLADFNMIFEKVYSITGVKPTIFRFPGGSINTYNQNFYRQLIAEMLRRGFVYYDWNVSSGDAGVTYTSAAIHSAVLNGIGSKSKSIVLMHDSSTKHATVGALQSIIDALKETHEFRPLDNTVEPTVFTYKDNSVGN
ncbi:MAG: polysaccharide deacetylase family protein [Oscillospiraceae bacterium]|nr:polysaccharide deacetylase family protein [Oscillospiraceae bacterium]